MSSAEILNELSKRGVVLTVRGDRLRYEPKQAVDDRLLSEMRRHRQDLLKWIWFADWIQEPWPGGFVVSTMVN
jgi:hypothetical protein